MVSLPNRHDAMLDVVSRPEETVLTSGIVRRTDQTALETLSTQDIVARRGDDDAIPGNRPESHEKGARNPVRMRNGSTDSGFGKSSVCDANSDKASGEMFAPDAKSFESGKETEHGFGASESASARSGAMPVSVRSLAASKVVDELDDSEELSGSRNVYDLTRGSRRVRSRLSRIRSEGASTKKSEGAAYSSESHGKTKASGSKSAKGAKSIGAEGAEKASGQALTSASQAAQTTAAAQVAQTASAAETTTAAGAAAGSGLAVIGGIMAAIIAFILGMLLISNIVSAIFGFWENEDSKRQIEGLPPYITVSMIETALQCQENYGHPAGCTLAQIIVESGMGDGLSGLAVQDNNLFGIKWSSSFATCPEVSGKQSWATQEEYDGELVTIMADFTIFNSFEDCITFRSRVLLQNSRYADNPFIQEAITEHSSDKMAEGLKDAGWATSSAYVESLKNALQTYNLYRFDGMTLEEFQNAGSNANAIVAAAYSQLGVPYVWGGCTPGVGMDCSGLTMWCYSQVGISISHYTETQLTQGKAVPLSQAKPGDILYRYGHVAIYVGGDQYIHAPDFGQVVQVASGISYFSCAIQF
ncbi:glucosaminidase domain-containing protein [Ellagibacter isourolithinifaciens]|uniref:glucosaminidase domain-containing protein n=1 Tax=Ellagibacter isourolithinifaciens TaxID=2137581 RepID=UPI0023F0CDBB|nr:glucosaminidase domain-containing protein [Ellagibacter isourolithinifaciens]MDD5925517.1 NlpC/P60 family protein [Ellagibacter isourolithinifaciens]